jgi:hypothetical protein
MTNIDLDKIRKIALIRARANSPIEEPKPLEDELTLQSMEEEILPKKLGSKPE